MKTIELLISGRVQKVGFRACIKKTASDLHVNGTVINLPDGRVQVYATADPMILEKFISMLYSCPRAVVRDIRTFEIPIKTYDDFSIIKGEGRISTGL